MATLEATRTHPIAAPYKASVVKGSAGYRAEQGSDYEPGVSTETVGSKSLWLGMITLPPRESIIEIPCGPEGCPLSQSFEPLRGYSIRLRWITRCPASFSA